MVFSEKGNNIIGTIEYCLCKYKRPVFTTNAVPSTRVHTYQRYISNSIEQLPMGKGVIIGMRGKEESNEIKQKKGLTWINGDNELRIKGCD